MLLEDDETQTPDRKTLKRCSRTSWLQNLLKYYPRPPFAPSLIKSRFFCILQFTYLLTSLHFWNSLYVYTRGILGCLLGFWPLGQNPAEAIMPVSTVFHGIVQTLPLEIKTFLNMPCKGNKGLNKFKRCKLQRCQSLRSVMQITAKTIRPVTSKKLQTFPEIGGNNGENIYPRARLIRQVLYSILRAWVNFESEERSSQWERGQLIEYTY